MIMFAGIPLVDDRVAHLFDPDIDATTASLFRHLPYCQTVRPKGDAIVLSRKIVESFWHKTGKAVFLPLHRRNIPSGL